MLTEIRRATKAGVTTLCASCLISAHASAATITVTNTGDNGPGTLRQAILDAAPGDDVVVTVAGTIALTSGPLVISHDLTITGQGPSALIIDGQRSSRIFTVGAPLSPVTVSISRLTLTNGNAQSGGAILNDGTLTLSEAVVSGNTAAVEGGAILNRGTLHIVASRISWNVAAVGGGIANRDGVVSLLWSTLSHNAAVGPYGGSGGAIASQSGTGDFGGGEARLGLDIRESTISDNSAALKGGAIFLATGLLTMINSTVANNSCSFSGDADACLCAGGGGIYNQLGKAVINSSTLAGNTAFAGGGSITSTYGLTTLKATLLATGSAGPNCVGYSADALKSDGYNLSDDESCVGALTGPGDLNGVPSGLSPMGLQLNGGWFLETIALLPTALLDTVPPEMCPETDQRQMPRPQGGACDVGSYERSAGSIAYSAEIQPPIKADGTSVFGTNRGVIPVKFVLKEYGTPTCQPSSVTIALARLSGPSTGPVSETTYELPADEGNTFRVDRESCQYVYNLSTAVLTPGTYWVSVTFGEVVGTVLFGIR